MISRASLMLMILAAGVVMSAAHKRPANSHRQSVENSPFYSPNAADDQVSRSTCVEGKSFKTDTFDSVSVKVVPFEPKNTNSESKIQDVISEFLKSQYDTDANTDFDAVRSEAEETFDFDNTFDMVTRTKYISTNFDQLRQAVFWLLTNKQHVIETTIPLKTIDQLASEIATCHQSFIVRDLKVPESNDLYTNVAEGSAVYFTQTLFAKCRDERNIELALHTGSLAISVQQSIIEAAEYDDAALASAIEGPSHTVRKLLFKNLLAYFGLI